MKFRLNDDDVKAAVWKIARTPEGQVLLSALQAVVEEIGPVETCALHAHNERRKFASDLIAMAEAENTNEPDGTDERRNVSPGGKRRTSRRHGPAGRA